MLFDVAELQGSAGSRPPSEASAAVGSRPWIIRGLAPSVLFAILAFWRNRWGREYDGYAQHRCVHPPLRKAEAAGAACASCSSSWLLRMLRR